MLSEYLVLKCDSDNEDADINVVALEIDGKVIDGKVDKWLPAYNYRAVNWEISWNFRGNLVGNFRKNSYTFPENVRV